MLSAQRLRQNHGRDEFAGLKHRFGLRGVAPEAMEIGNRYRPRRPVWFHGFDHCVEHPQRHGHVSGVSGNAGIRNADDTQLPRKTA